MNVIAEILRSQTTARKRKRVKRGNTSAARAVRARASGRNVKEYEKVEKKISKK